MASITRQPERQLTTGAPEQLPSFMIPEALDAYYGALPHYIDRMPTDDLIARANDPEHVDDVLSRWERGYEDSATGRVVYGALEPHAAKYAQDSGARDEQEKARLQEDAFYGVILPHVDTKVQTAIRTELLKRTFAVADQRTPDQIATTYLKHLETYEPVNLEHAWNLSNDIFSRFLELGRSAPIVRERLYEAFAAVSANSERELRVPYSASGVRTTMAVAKVGILHARLTSEIEKAGRFGRVPDLDAVSRKFAPLYERLGYDVPAMQAAITPTNARLVVGTAKDTLFTLGRASEAAARVAKDRVELPSGTALLNASVVAGTGLSLLLSVPGSAEAAPKAQSSVTLQVPEIRTLDLTGATETVALNSALPAAFVESNTIRSGEKCDTPFVYDDNMKLAVARLKARGGKWTDQAIVLDFFLEKCMGLKASAGIVGNSEEESGTNPRRHQVNGPAQGDFMWEAGRLENLLKQPNPYTHNTQLNFAWKEMINGNMIDTLQGAKSAEDGAVIFERLFERAGIKHLDVRKGHARDVYSAFLAELKQVDEGHSSVSHAAAVRIVASPDMHSAAPALFESLHASVDTPGVAVDVSLDNSAGSEATVSTQVVNSLLGRLGVETATADNQTPSLLVDPATTTANTGAATPVHEVALSAVPQSLLASINSQPDVQNQAPEQSLLVSPADAAPSPQTPDINSSPAAAPSLTAPDLNPATTPAPTASPDTAAASAPSTTPETPAPQSTPSTSDLMQAFMNADKPSASTADSAPVQVDLSTPTDPKQGTVDVPLNQTADTAPNSATVQQTPDTQTVNANGTAVTQQATPPKQEVKTDNNNKVDSVKERRQAEITQLKDSGFFKKSQAVKKGDVAAPRTPLEKKLADQGEQNGRLHNVERLGDKWGNASLYAPAAEQFRKMNEAFRAARGHDLVINDSYRSYDRQVATKADAESKGRSQFAATPGQSKHGWGLAIDLGGGMQSFNSDDYAWMKAHALDFGFNHPDFADDSSSPEPWHWEYVLSE